MANNYYNFTTPFIPGTKVRSEQVNSNYSGIESGFDLLPTDPVSSIIGTAWFGTEAQGATVNEFQVTTPDPQTAVTNGQRVAFFATHTNTGAATLDVDGTGVFNMVNFNGSAFVGGEVVSGQWYEFVYDSANNFWLVAAAVDNALQVTYAQEWANNPVGTLVSAAAGGDQVDDYSSLHWAVGSENWATRAEDDPIPVIFGGDGATDFSAFHWAQKAQAFSGLPVSTTDGEFIYGSGGAFGQISGDAFNWDDSNFIFQLQGGQARMVIDETDGGGDSRVQLTSTTTADGGAALLFDSGTGRLALQQTDDAGNLEDLWLNAQRNGLVGVYFNGTLIASTDSRGFVINGGSSLYIAEQAAANLDTASFGQLIVREGAAGDPLFSEVELLAEFEGADGATSYTEISNNGFSTTFNGNAQIDTAQFNSRAASLLLDGTGDFASYADNAAFEMGTDDWTVEGFVRFNTLPPLGASNNPGFCLFSQWGAAAGDQKVSYHIIQDAFGFRVQLRFSSGGLEVGTISGGISTGVWYHWAMTRSSGDGNIRAYFNGNYEVADFGAADANLGRSSEGIRIGSLDGAGTGDHDGWIDDVRFNVGTARYTGTGSYTIPTTPYATSAGEHDLVFRTDQGSEFVLGGGSGNRVTGDINTATPPTTEAITALLQYTDLAGDDVIGSLGYNGSNLLQLSNNMQGGNFQLNLIDSLGNTRNPIFVDAADQVRLDYPGFQPKKKVLGDLRRMETANSGIDVYGSADNDGDPTLGETQDTLVTLRNNSGNIVGSLGFNIAGALELTNDVYESRIDLYTTDDAGGSIAQIEMAFGAANGITFFTHSGGRQFRMVDTGDKKDTTARFNITGADQGNSNGQDAAIGFVDNILTPVDRAVVGYEGSDVFNIRGIVGQVLMDSPTGVILGYNSLNRAVTGASGALQVRSDTNNDADERELQLALQDGTVVGGFGQTSNSEELFIRNLINDADADMIFTTANANAEMLFRPNGSQRFRVFGSGAMVTAASANTAAYYIGAATTSTTQRAILGYRASDTLDILNNVDSGEVHIRGNDNLSQERLLITADPDDNVVLFHNPGGGAIEVARTLDDGDGGFEVNNDLTGSGFERVLTVSDAPANLVQRVKTANESVTNSTTYQNDNHITGMALVVGQWSLSGAWQGTQPAATTGLKFRWSDSGGAFTGSQGYCIMYRADTGASPSDGDMYWTTVDGVVGALINALNTGEMFGFWQGICGIGTSTKTLTLQWAQVVANASASNLNQNTWQRWERTDSP